MSNRILWGAIILLQCVPSLLIVTLDVPVPSQSNLNLGFDYSPSLCLDYSSFINRHLIVVSTGN